MNEKQTAESKTTRPTKKQKELLDFISAFIAEHGYSPSYREIMSGLNYTSVATVSLHVNNLIWCPAAVIGSGVFNLGSMENVIIILTAVSAVLGLRQAWMNFKN